MRALIFLIVFFVSCLSHNDLFAAKARPVVIAISYDGDPAVATWSFEAWLNGNRSEIVTTATRYGVVNGHFCLFFDLQKFSSWKVNDILHVSVKCAVGEQVLTTNPWTGTIGASALSTQWLTDESTFLKFPSSISLSGDFQLCEGQELGESRELTVMNAPEGANVRVFDGAVDVTSKFVVTGMTGLSIKPAAFTETSDNLSVVLVDADRTKLAEAPFRVNVKPHQVVKLSGDFAGRKLGDELLFETNRDEAVIPGAYYWFVNGQVVNGGCGWFVSNKLQEGDAVKCIVEEEGGCAQRSVSNEVIVRYKGKDHAHDAIKAGEWDNGGFFVPNVITPNNDGLNDTWRLDFIQDYPDHLVTIYDYSGRVVYRTRHYNNDWEGRIDNVITYGVYTCVVDLGNRKTLKTWLLVKNNEVR